MKTLIQVNNETISNFIDVKPQIGSYEDYKSYPKDKFFLLDEYTFESCVLKDDNYLFHGILILSQFYFMEKKDDNYILTRYDYSLMNSQEKDYFNNMLKGGNIFLSRDFYKEFDMNEEELYKVGINNIGKSCKQRVQDIINERNSDFKNILNYCNNQTNAIRTSAQIIGSMNVCNINFITGVEDLTDDMHQYITDLNEINSDTEETQDDNSYEIPDETNFIFNELDLEEELNEVINEYSDNQELEEIDVPKDVNLSVDFNAMDLNDNKIEIELKLKNHRSELDNKTMRQREMKKYLDSLQISYETSDTKDTLTKKLIDYLDSQQSTNSNFFELDFPF